MGFFVIYKCKKLFISGVKQMKECKLYFEAVKSYLNDSTLILSEKKLDKLIEEELEKPVDEMDPKLIDLCIVALGACQKLYDAQAVFPN